MRRGAGWGLVVVLAGLTSCSSLGRVFDSRGDSGLEEVDGLLGAVERAHLECELSRNESAAALDTLHAIVAPDFRGDAIQGYASLQLALERSLEQAAALRETLGPMASAAQDVAASWELDLAAYSSEVMRAKSAARLAETTDAYLAVEAPLRAACQAFDRFNIGLTDHVLYLEHDLNPAAVAAIEDELVLLTELQRQLDEELERSMLAAGDYVRGAALSGQLDVTAPPPLAEPVVVARAGLRDRTTH